MNEEKMGNISNKHLFMLLIDKGYSLIAIDIDEIHHIASYLMTKKKP